MKSPRLKFRMQSKFWNYTSTYRVLLKSYFLWSPRKAVISALAVTLVAAALPVPFFLLARAPFAETNQGGTVSFPLGIQISVQWTVAIALISFLFIAVLQFMVDRRVILNNLAWQDYIFRQAVRSLPRFARIDRTIALPLPLNLNDMLRIISQGTRSTFLVARLISVGLKDFATVIVTLAILAVLNFNYLLLIIGVSLLFLPLYLAAGSEMVNLRRGREVSISQVRQEALGLIGQAASMEACEDEKISAVDRRCDGVETSQLYDLSNRQMAILAKLRLYAVIHAVCVAFIVIYWSSGFERSFSVKDAGYLAILLIFLKSFLSIVALLARFTRGYIGMAVLRQIIEPKRKRILDYPGSASLPGRGLYVSGKRGGIVALSPERATYLLMPPVEYAFELVALSNAIRQTGRFDRAGCGWIGLAAKRQAADAAGCYSEPGNDCGAIVYNAEDWAAMSEAGWRGLPRADGLGGQDDGPIVLVRVGPQSNIDFPEGSQMIVCDKQSVLDAGNAREMFELYRETIAKADLKAKKRLIEDDDEEDM